MENASKALLIAAAVLIVILLIAFGMRVFNSTGDTSESAEKVGGVIKEQSGKASDYATEALADIKGSSDTVEDEISFAIYFGNTEAKQTFKAKKNMTWKDFINSTYNNGSYRLELNATTNVVQCFIEDWYYGVYDNDNTTIQKGNTTIKNGAKYRYLSR